MDINQITQLIGSFGFPIVACGAMFWYMTKLIERFDKMLNQQTDKHEEEIRSLSKTIENNTEIMNELLIYVRGSKNAQNT